MHAEAVIVQHSDVLAGQPQRLLQSIPMDISPIE